MFLGNEPDFIWIWLGLAKLGCAAALLNYNIRSKSLLHCFSCCGAHALIAAPDVLYIVKCIVRGFRIRSYAKEKPFYSTLEKFLEAVQKQPDKPFIVFENKTYSYLDADKQSNKVASALQKHAGLKEGDTVAMFLGNEPDFIWIWLGLAKLGCSAALLNYNIRSKSLLHCFSCCGAHALIAAPELKGAVEDVLVSLQEQNVSVFILSEESTTPGIESLNDKIHQASDQPLPQSLRSNVTIKNVLYIVKCIGRGFRIRSYAKKKPFYSTLEKFLEAVQKQPDKPFIVFENKTYSYLDADKQSNKVASALQKHAGLKEGDTVAMFLGNEPDFIWIWLGLAKLGCAAALLNYNIRSKSLLHCFSCCGAHALIAAPDVLYIVKCIVRGFRIRSYAKEKPFYSTLEKFLEAVQKQPDKPFIVFENKTYSYLDADKQSNKVASALQKHAGLKEGDTVAMFLGNEPDFIWIWLGLAKLGCAAALLNYNIRSKSLLHCFSCCGAHALIAAPELKGAVEDVLVSLQEQNVSVFILSEESTTPGIESLNDKIHQASDQPLPQSLRSNVTIKSTAVYIYTSGTTGLPKAAVITQERLWAGASFLRINAVLSQDVVYVNLPLYHSAGFMIGLMGSIDMGTTVVLRRKFSASQFWDDCRKHNVTVIQYIGEVLRYLCNVPKQDGDRDHKVRIAIGNGVRVEVWKEFLNRFGDIQVREFYAATEGNIGFLNYVGKIGAVGRANYFHKQDGDRDHKVRIAIGNGVRVEVWKEFLNRFGDIQVREFYAATEGNIGFLNYVGKIGAVGRANYFHKKLFPYALIQYDTEREEPVRDSRGLCVPAPKGETGLLVTKITKVASFIGYAGNPQQTDKKKLRDVFEKGDLYFNSGDLLKIDHDNFVYFQDRIGDTFRSLIELIAVGVIAFEDSFCPYIIFQLQPLEEYIHSGKNSLEITGTFKQMKVKLAEEGFDPAVVQDPLYFLDENEKTYVPMTQEMYNAIISKHVKL
ncbi:UNVERIFIED_CONTAM: hypothetical protein FKN15_047179 [Acipenser sinensis]